MRRRNWVLSALSAVALFGATAMARDWIDVDLDVPDTIPTVAQDNESVFITNTGTAPAAGTVASLTVDAGGRLYIGFTGRDAAASIPGAIASDKTTVGVTGDMIVNGMTWVGTWDMTNPSNAMYLMIFPELPAAPSGQVDLNVGGDLILNTAMYVGADGAGSATNITVTGDTVIKAGGNHFVGYNNGSLVFTTNTFQLDGGEIEVIGSAAAGGINKTQVITTQGSGNAVHSVQRVRTHHHAERPVRPVERRRLQGRRRQHPDRRQRRGRNQARLGGQPQHFRRFGPVPPARFAEGHGRGFHGDHRRHDDLRLLPHHAHARRRVHLLHRHRHHFRRDGRLRRGDRVRQEGARVLHLDHDRRQRHRHRRHNVPDLQSRSHLGQRRGQDAGRQLLRQVRLHPERRPDRLQACRGRRLFRRHGDGPGRHERPDQAGLRRQQRRRPEHSAGPGAERGGGGPGGHGRDHAGHRRGQERRIRRGRAEHRHAERPVGREQLFHRRRRQRQLQHRLRQRPERQPRLQRQRRVHGRLRAGRERHLRPRRGQQPGAGQGSGGDRLRLRPRLPGPELRLHEPGLGRGPRHVGGRGQPQGHVRLQVRLLRRRRRLRPGVRRVHRRRGLRLQLRRLRRQGGDGARLGHRELRLQPLRHLQPLLRVLRLGHGRLHLLGQRHQRVRRRELGPRGLPHRHLEHRAKFGYDWKPVSCLTLTPSVGINYVHAKNSSHDVNYGGVSLLRYGSMKNHSTSLPSELAASYDIVTGDESKLTLNGNVGYSYNFHDDGVEGNIFMNGLSGGTALRATGRESGRHTFNIGAGLRYTHKRFDFGVKYDYYGKADYDAHRVVGTVGISF